jgi:Protein of unknown function (DUF2845)
MMKPKIIIGTILLTITLTAHTAMALRCGNLFVEPGVTSVEILVNCGEPISKEVLGASGRSGAVKERWAYGPKSGYYYLLYFKAGVLEKIESKKK